uniref:Acid phosphatase n=1 Tax=Yarrowia lipolytica TaxID=4952 RepID=V9H116_YARLL|nr:acid phosphatase (EC 3.1.3.2) - yeast (Yarrowia lipolytica) [Yarrowia lipolytica]CAA46332.1 acid phosphatase [Yarrowia lipolytica]
MISRLVTRERTVAGRSKLDQTSVEELSLGSKSTRGVIVGRDDRNGGVAAPVVDDVSLIGKEAVSVQAGLGSIRLDISVLEQACSLVENQFVGDGASAGLSGEDRLGISALSSRINVPNQRKIDRETDTVGQNRRSHLGVFEQVLDNGSGGLGVDVVGGGLGVGGVGVVSVLVLSREGNCRNASQNRGVHGSLSSRQGVDEGTEVPALIGSRHNQVDGDVVVELGQSVVETKGHGSSGGSVKVPDVVVLLVLAPSRSSNGSRAPLGTLGESSVLWEHKGASGSRLLQGRGKHEHVVALLLELIVESSNVSRGPRIVIGDDNGGL